MLLSRTAMALLAGATLIVAWGGVALNHMNRHTLVSAASTSHSTRQAYQRGVRSIDTLPTKENASIVNNIASSMGTMDGVNNGGMDGDVTAGMWQQTHQVLCKPHVDSPFVPKLIFIAGIEGSGHHGFVPLFRDMNGTVFLRRAEQLFTDFWDPTLSIEYRVKLRGKLLVILQNAFDDCVRDAAVPAHNCSHFILAGNANFFSYPYDSPRNPLRHPDLLELENMLRDPRLKVKYDLKVLVLHRQPFKTVQSGLRRGFVDAEKCAREVNRGKRIQYKGKCDALLFLAREAEMHLTYLNSELGALSAAYFRVIDFSHFLTFTGQYVDLISNFLEFRQETKAVLAREFEKRFKGHVKRSPARGALYIEYLSSLFTKVRLLRWPVLESGAYDIRSLDHVHDDGEARLGYSCYDNSKYT